MHSLLSVVYANSARSVASSLGNRLNNFRHDSRVVHGLRIPGWDVPSNGFNEMVRRLIHQHEQVAATVDLDQRLCLWILRLHESPDQPIASFLDRFLECRKMTLYAGR
jgi:hypothetical protein